MRKIILLLLLLSLPIGLYSQSDFGPIRLKPLIYFLGEWLGEESGKAGIGKGTREYTYLMDTTYILHKNVSRFEPQEKNPKGETHQDWGIFSYDKGRKKIVLREFHSEGFVITYALDRISQNPMSLTFVSEHIENAPPDWRARVTFNIVNENEFRELFEIATAERDFEIWINNRWTRKK